MNTLAKKEKDLPVSIEPSLNAESIKRIQRDNINATLDFCLQHSPYYKDHLKGISLLSSVDQIQTLPFTEKDTFASSIDAFLCVPEEEVVDISTTSGSTGKPLLIKLTRNDLDRLAYNEFLSFSVCGLMPKQKVLLSVTLDKCFMAGLAYFSGLQKLGASVVRVGPGSPDMFLSLVQQTKPTVIIGVPSYLLRVHDYAKKQGFDLSAVNVKKLILIGEPIREHSFSLNSSGKRLTQVWQSSLYSTYGATEIQTSFCECISGQGGHLHPELIHVEIVDDGGIPVQAGEIGEVVITTFGVQGMPLIRYKTGDISFLQTQACTCGLITPRLGPILGRKGQKLKIKGTTLYPQSIMNILDEMIEIDDYVVIVMPAQDLGDEVEIRLCSRLPSNDWMPTLTERFKGQLKVMPRLVITDAGEITNLQSLNSERKKNRLLDRRKS
jgi:phenylacetate-CoA ligase